MTYAGLRELVAQYGGDPDQVTYAQIAKLQMLLRAEAARDRAAAEWLEALRWPAGKPPMGPRLVNFRKGEPK